MREILRQVLKAKNMSQKELAEKLYVTPQAVSRWMCGESRPSQDNVVAIYELLGVDLTKEVAKRKKKCSSINMKEKELAQIDEYEKAKKEAAVILADAGIVGKYSHPVYQLLSWLVPAVIGLTYHQLLKSSEEQEVDYSCIMINLKEYLDPSCPKKVKGLYENALEYAFFLMGADLFESFDDHQIPDHDYCSAAMSDWYRFQSSVIKNPASAVYCELIVAISEIASLYE